MVGNRDGLLGHKGNAERSLVWKEAILQDWSRKDDAGLTLRIQHRFVSQEEPPAREKEVAWSCWLSEEKGSLGVLQDLSKAHVPPHGSSNFILQAGGMSRFSGLRKHLTPSLLSQERAKRSGSPSERCAVAMDMSRKPEVGILLPPITWHHRMGGEVVDFPKNALCCTEDVWTGRKLAPLRNKRVQSYHWNPGNNNGHLQVLYDIILFFACVCDIAIFFLLHF